MRRVVVTGMGVVSPLGDTPGGVHDALCAGTSGLAPVEGFATDGIACRRAGELRGFDPQAYLGERNLRPLDRTSRLLVVAAGRALAASGWTPERLAAHEVGLALGTVFCSVRTISEFDRRSLTLGPNYASPLDFANSVLNAAAGQAAIWHGLRGVNSTLAGGEASSLLAIGYAADQIRAGRAEAVLAAGAEELCYETFLGFARAGRLCGGDGDGEGRPVPFDRRRDGFAPAEGAAVLVLEEAEAAAARGARPLAFVRGHGTAFDPTRGGAGAAGAVARAVRAALADAGATPGEVAVLSASANGSPEGDRHEAQGVARALGDRAAGLPVAAIKSMLGEALGAAGAFQAIDLVETLRGGVLPGILGLEETEDGFPLPGALGGTRPVDPIGARPMAAGPGGAGLGLATAVAADGQCAAVLLAAAE